MTPQLYISRARLRSGRGEALSAIAPILLPDDDKRRAGLAHRLVWLLFQERLDAKRDFLWRDEGDGNYVILSKSKPADPSALFDLDTKSFEPHLSAGDTLRFALRANATVARKGELSSNDRAARKRGKRCDVVMDALKSIPPGSRALERDKIAATAGEKWLNQQGALAGFALKNLCVRAYQKFDLADEARRGRRDRAGVWVLDLEGTISVTEPTAFVAKLGCGFGSARAFGNGLMLIRRAAGE